MRRTLGGVGLALCLTGAAAVIVSRRGDEPSAPTAAPTAYVPGASGATPSTVLPSERPARRPRSLRGTRTDGGLLVDSDGRFVPTLDARRLFDYFLTTEGELEPEALRARIVREIEHRLPPAAARDAAALLDRYLAYREALRTRVAADPTGPDDLEGRLAMLVALRREVLGEVAATAFFSAEETEARLLLETRRILGDQTLPPEERAAHVEELYTDHDATLPDGVRAARAAGRLAAMLPAAEAEVRARGGGDAEIQALRERLAGPEAAARLADLDQRRAAWDARVDAYRAARARLEHDATLTPDARAGAVARLLSESFTPAERLRVAALDRLAANAADAAPPAP
jgi:lipase chaperone LimK